MLLAVASRDAARAETTLRGAEDPQGLADRAPVVDRDAEETSCPACHATFPGSASRCPDCGLNFG